MRKEKIITLEDGEQKHKFKLKQMGALKIQRWGLKAVTALASTGVLSVEIPDESVGNLGKSLGALGRQVQHSGLDMLRGLDPAKADALLLELVHDTAVRVVGQAELELTENEIADCIEDVKTLIELESECFSINFSGLLAESQSESPQDQPTPEPVNTSKRGISVRNLPAS